MAKQIILTQYDFGIEISPTFIDDKKNKIDLTNCTLEIAFIKPDGETLYENGQVLDAVNGLTSFILDTKHTNILGLYKTYWQVINENSEITAQDEIYYFVRPKLGGAYNEENN